MHNFIKQNVKNYGDRQSFPTWIFSFFFGCWTSRGRQDGESARGFATAGVCRRNVGLLILEVGVGSFWQARTEEVARKPEKKKEVQTNRQELTVGLGKRKGKRRKKDVYCVTRRACRESTALCPSAVQGFLNAILCFATFIFCWILRIHKCLRVCTFF